MDRQPKFEDEALEYANEKHYDKVEFYGFLDNNEVYSPYSDWMIDAVIGLPCFIVIDENGNKHFTGHSPEGLEIIRKIHEQYK